MRKRNQRVFKEFFNNRLILARDNLAVTQEEMAHRLSMSPRTFSDLERGRSGCGALTLALFMIYICTHKILGQSHLLHPHSPQTSQLPSKRISAPHSGHFALGVGCVVTVVSWRCMLLSDSTILAFVSSSAKHLSWILLQSSSIAKPKADGQDVPLLVSPLSKCLVLYAGHVRTFLSCDTTSSGATPALQHNEISLEIASEFLSHFYTLSFEIL